jgi:trk/ktr system potassium uptake protein
MRVPVPRNTPLAVLAPFGAMLTLVSLTMLPPIGIELIYRDGSIAPFADSFWLMLLTGLALWLPFRRAGFELRNRQGFVVVVALWVSVCAMSALPFLLATRPHMPLADALFESTSGLTTTGATVFSAVDGLPHSILYYRAQLNFIGGIGIVVLAVAVLPLIGVGGMQLYRAETPGPFKDEKLTPRIKETAKRLSIVYVVLIALCAGAFRLAGMDLFDAVTHSFATLALGGFSTHTDSLGFFHSSAVELVAGVFSLIAGLNFGLLYLGWYRRSPAPLLKDPELRFYLGVLALLILVVCLWLWLSGAFPLREALYHGFFQTASIVTDNGLVAADYPHWPAPLALLLIMGSFFGGCVGSTCGGIKAMRFLLLAKQSMHEVRLLIHPHGRFFVKLGHRPIPERAMQAVWGFYFLYVFVYCTFSLAVTATGVDIITAFGSMAGCLNNMGVGYGATSANFGVLNPTAKWLLVAAMLLGRLELFPVLMLLTPSYWRN